MKQLDTRWFEWSRYDPSLRQDAHGYFLAGEVGAPGVLIDPVPFAEGDEAHLNELGGVGAVVVTGPSRLDAARACAAAFHATLYAPAPSAAPSVSTAHGEAAVPGVGERTYADAETLPGGLTTVLIRTGSSGSQAALVHEASATALSGELVVGGPGGALQLELPEGEVPAVARALRGALAVRVRRILVARGTSVLQNGDRGLQDLVYRHDPAAFLLRKSELRWDSPGEPWSLGSRFAARFAECSSLLGLKTLDFDLADVPPGKQSGQLHRHDGEEEVFVILSGKGEVLTSVTPLDGAQPHLPTQALAIEAGDVLGPSQPPPNALRSPRRDPLTPCGRMRPPVVRCAGARLFPPRYQVAHAFRNTGDEPLRYLAFGAPAETLEMVDYPETGIRLERTPFGKRHRFTLPEDRSVPYWDTVRTE